MTQDTEKERAEQLANEIERMHWQFTEDMLGLFGEPPAFDEMSGEYIDRVHQLAWLAYNYGAEQAASRAPVVPAWKDHQTAKLVNDLRECAINYHQAGQLRERIAQIIRPLTDALQSAPVVPQGWSLREAAQDALDWLEEDDVNLTHNIRERLRAALAAAPQPPEAEAKWCIHCSSSAGSACQSKCANRVCPRGQPQPPACNPSMQPEHATHNQPR